VGDMFDPEWAPQKITTVLCISIVSTPLVTLSQNALFTYQIYDTPAGPVRRVLRVQRILLILSHSTIFTISTISKLILRNSM
jgi:hypothetical protein